MKVMCHLQIEPAHSCPDSSEGSTLELMVYNVWNGRKKYVLEDGKQKRKINTLLSGSFETKQFLKSVSL